MVISCYYKICVRICLRMEILEDTTRHTLMKSCCLMSLSCLSCCWTKTKTTMTRMTMSCCLKMTCVWFRVWSRQCCVCKAHCNVNDVYVMYTANMYVHYHSYQHCMRGKNIRVERCRPAHRPAHFVECPHA